MGRDSFKFLHLSDTHLGYVQYGLPERAVDFAKSLAAALRHGVDEKVDFILIAGDFFEKKNPDSTSFLHAIQTLSIPRDAGIPVFVIAGNHDKAYYDQESCWLDVLNADDHCHLLSHDVDPDGNLKLVPWKSSSKTGSYWEHPTLPVRILGVPHLGSHTASLIPRIAAEVPRDRRYNVLMMHCGIHGQISGDTDSVAIGDFAPLKGKVDYVALGHYHKRFQIDGWIHNPGGTENRSISETRDPHGYVIVDVENGQTKTRFFPGERRPYHDLTFTIDAHETASSLVDKLRPMVETAVKSDPKPALVHVTLEGALVEQYASLNLKDAEEQLGQSPNVLALRLKPMFDQNVAHVRVATGDFDLGAVERSVIQQFLPTAMPDAPATVHDAVVEEVLSLKRAVIEKAAPEKVYGTLHAWRKRILPLAEAPR